MDWTAFAAENARLEFGTAIASAAQRLAAEHQAVMQTAVAQQPVNTTLAVKALDRLRQQIADRFRGSVRSRLFAELDIMERTLLTCARRKDVTDGRETC